jgi:formylglycine-generating enzyme required for sulfatase activity
VGADFRNDANDQRALWFVIGFAVSLACGGSTPETKAPAVSNGRSEGVMLVALSGSDAGHNVALVSATPPSCAPGGPGLSDCGAAKESCCLSPLVSGGTYYRTYPHGALVGGRWQVNQVTTKAKVSSFRLDKYDVTVGRFRQFVAAWSGGWMPPSGSGKHTHLNGAQGLVNSGPGGGYEPGWIPQDWIPWDASSMAPPSANLACDNPSLATWTPSVSTQENLPINCMNWWEAYAFCIWDGGFLPSEVEWEYAATGGSQQRKYPWGAEQPGTANQYAIYHCYYHDSRNCTGGVQNIAPVGTALMGACLYGQFDLVGNVFQWTLDYWHEGYTDCTDCARTTEDAVPEAVTQWCASCADPRRVVRGGQFATPTLPTWRQSQTPQTRWPGFRCARTP